MSTTSEVFVDATPTNPLRPITAADLAAYDATTRTRNTAAEAAGDGVGGPVGGGSADRTPHTALPQPAARNQAISADGAPGKPHTALVRMPQLGPVTESNKPVDSDDAEPLTGRIRRLISDGLPEVFTAPAPSLAERLRYSRDGAWSTSTEGAARVAHRVYTTAVANPVTIVAYLAAWAVERPMRLAFLALLLLVGGSALGSGLGLDWLIPNAINVPTWF